MVSANRLIAAGLPGQNFVIALAVVFQQSCEVIAVLKLIRFAMAATLVLGCRSDPALAGADAAPPAPAKAAADCWVDHTQVQPSPPRQGSVGTPTVDPAYRLMSDAHPGAEHPTPARKRPCTSLPPRQGLGLRLPESRSLAP